MKLYQYFITNYLGGTIEKTAAIVAKACPTRALSMFNVEEQI
jgi:hypothetical protein